MVKEWPAVPPDDDGPLLTLCGGERENIRTIAEDHIRYLVKCDARPAAGKNDALFAGVAGHVSGNGAIRRECDVAGLEAIDRRPEQPGLEHRIPKPPVDCDRHRGDEENCQSGSALQRKAFLPRAAGRPRCSDRGIESTAAAAAELFRW